MESLVTHLFAQVTALSLYLAAITVAIFLLLLVTRQKIRQYLGLKNHTRLTWFIELLALPLLLFSSWALMYHLLAGLPEATVTPQTLSKIFISLLWLLGAWLLNRGLALFFWDEPFRQMFQTEVPNLLRGIVAASIYLLALYGIVTFVLEYQTTGVLISTGIIAGVLGLALQNILSDLFSGVAVTLDRPYSVGHWIELPDGVLGKVVDITWKSTRIRSFNNSIYIIPNRLASDSIVHNYNLPEKAYSLWFTVSVDADAPPTVVRRLLLDAVLKSSRVLKEPPPAVRLFDMTGQPYQYLVWVYFEDYMAQFMGKEQVFMNVWLEFSKIGILPAAAKSNVATHQESHRPEIYGPTIADELKQVELFDSLSSTEIDALSQMCQKRIFTAQDVILEAGTASDAMYIISSGIVSMQQPNPQGQPVELEKLESGNYFGAMSLLTGQPSTTTVTAITLCELIEIPQAGLEPILQANPAILNTLARIMARRQAKQAKLAPGDSSYSSGLIRRSAAEIVSKIRKAFGLKADT